MPDPDQYIALSCAVVGVGLGGTTSMLARVVLVDFRGNLVLDTFVQPTMQVTDYRTGITGIHPSDIHSEQACKFNDVQRHVAGIINGKVLVGHSLWNALSVLGIPHPAASTRDVALYLPFRRGLKSSGNQIIGLQTLMWQLMQRRVQQGFINPLENARAAIDLYRSDAKEWEGKVEQNKWPCALPPNRFSRCYT